MEVFTRAADSEGKTLDLLLCAKRNTQAAKRFFAKTLKVDRTAEPRVIHADQNAGYPRAYDAVQEEEQLPESCMLRQCEYLNNIIE